ncbi:MAG: hypothetical protein V4494_04480 [Chlamydiota bacterium]
MKSALAKEHREFYAHNHFIDFEELISPEEACTLSKNIKKTLTKRSQKDHLSSNYLAGRDLWRDDLEIKKIVFKRSFAEIAKELFKQPLIKIAFDQYQENTSLLSLAQMSCLKPIIGALAIPLGTPGKAIYFSPGSPLTFPFCEEPLLLIAYTGNKTQYTLTESDPNTHTLKKLGYSFGDHITSETHPIIIR